jgi:hypothetical protein
LRFKAKQLKGKSHEHCTRKINRPVTLAVRVTSQRTVEAQQRKIEKQEATITELKSTIARQQSGMEVLTARLEEQASQIQKVSAQFEMSQPAPHVVQNR